MTAISGCSGTDVARPGLLPGDRPRSSLRLGVRTCRVGREYRPVGRWVACRGSPSICWTFLPAVLRVLSWTSTGAASCSGAWTSPAEHVPAADLRWLLSMPVWSFEGEHLKVSPAQVRADPARYRIHYAQALAADLSFPLHVLVRAHRVVTVLDGFHRLLKVT